MRERDEETWYRLLLIGMLKGPYLVEYINTQVLNAMQGRGWLDQENQLTAVGRTVATSCAVAYKLGAYREEDD